MDNRVINTLPPPYYKDATPYMQRNFSEEIQSGFHKIAAHYLNVCKTIFVGDVAVGKTTLVNRFCYNNFRDSYKATIGVDFEIENFKVMDVNFNLQIWDTAGQERFKCIAHAYYRNANVIVIIFDMTKIETLRTAPEWLSSALTVNSQKPLVFLVGTKCDLLKPDDMNLMEDIAVELAKSIDAEYWSVSAKTGFGVVQLFRRIVALSFNETVKQSLVDGNPTKSVTSSFLRLNKLPKTDNSKLGLSKCALCHVC